MRDRARVTRVDPFASPTTGAAIELDASQRGVMTVEVPADRIAFYVIAAQ